MKKYNWKGYNFIGTDPNLQKNLGTAKLRLLSMP